MDNCGLDANPTQTDTDADLHGDACDPTPRGPDADGDGKPLLDDACPNQYGTAPNGCPVPVTPTPAPVPTPAPIASDSDGDGFANASDACPFEGATTINGCPVPAVAELSAKVRRCSRGRCATVRVQTNRAATVRVTFKRRTCRRGRCRWVRVQRKTTTTTRNVAKAKSKRLSRGRYRAVVVISSSAGRARPETDKFRVR